jgi:hypothetical protein
VPDDRVVPWVDDEGEPITLQEALARRDELIARHGDGACKRITSIEAARRLGWLQAHADVMRR